MMIEFISNNALLSALIAAILIAVTASIWNWGQDHKDSRTIYNFLKSSDSETNFKFRSTEAISSKTNISEKRVAKLCSKHPKIRRNEKEKQSWTLIQ